MLPTQNWWLNVQIARSHHLKHDQITASSSQKNKDGTERVHGSPRFSSSSPLRNVAVHGSSRPSTPRSRLRTEGATGAAGRAQIVSGARHLFSFETSSHLIAELTQDVSSQRSIIKVRKTGQDKSNNTQLLMYRNFCIRKSGTLFVLVPHY